MSDAPLDIRFACTQCGSCCRNTKIPLTAAEAVGWLRDGNRVQIICEASPWMTDASAEDPRAAHVKRRSFAARSGSLSLRIVVMLVANVVGECPNLLRDMRCGIYARRPLVCRIYPAEINPIVELEIAKKACPPEAWTADRPLLMRNGNLAIDEVRGDVQRWRETDARESGVREGLCRALGLTDAAVAREGFVVHSPASDSLLAGLLAALHADSPPAVTDWRLVTDRDDTFARLAADGAVALRPGDATTPAYQYIGLKRT